jgi:hypothetical protein
MNCSLYRDTIVQLIMTLYNSTKINFVNLLCIAAMEEKTCIYYTIILYVVIINLPLPTCVFV